MNTTLSDIFNDSTKLPIYDTEQKDSMSQNLVNSRDTNSHFNQKQILDSSEGPRMLDIGTSPDDEVFTSEESQEDFINQSSDVLTRKFKSSPLPPFEMLNYDPQPFSTMKTSSSKNSASSEAINVQSELFNVQLTPESISPVEANDMLDSKSDICESPENLELTSVSREIAELLQELRATSMDRDFDGLSIRKSVEFPEESQYLDDVCDDCFYNQSVQMPSSMR